MVPQHSRFPIADCQLPIFKTGLVSGFPIVNFDCRSVIGDLRSPISERLPNFPSNQQSAVKNRQSLKTPESSFRGRNDLQLADFEGETAIERLALVANT